MDPCRVVPTQVFRALLTEDFSSLFTSCSAEDVSLVYPFLLRLVAADHEGLVSIATSVPSSYSISSGRDMCRVALSADPRAAGLNAYLSVLFPELEAELLQQLTIRRSKSAALTFGSMSVSGRLEMPKSTATADVALRFENADFAERYLLLLSELFSTEQSLADGLLATDLMRFELLDNSLYFDDCCAMLCFAIAEMPEVMTVDQLCEPLLCYRNGPLVIQRLAANFPHTFSAVLSSLVSKGEHIEKCGVICRQRNDAIRLLHFMNPDCVMEIITLCVNQQKLPMLMVSLTVEYCSFRTLSTLLNGILQDDKSYGRSWFMRFVHASQKAQADEALRDTLQMVKAKIKGEIEALLQRRDASKYGVLTCADAQQSVDIIRLCFQLKYTGNWRLTEEDLKFLIRLICSKVTCDAAGTQYLCMSMVSLFALASVVSVSDRALLSWIDWLISAKRAFHSLGNTGFDELLLMLAINVHTDQLQRLQGLASSMLSLKISLHSSNLKKLKMFLIDKIFSDSFISEIAANVSATPNLTANSEGLLPVLYIKELLHCSAFSKQKFRISRWMFEQMTQCGTPVHKDVPSLIEAYVDSCFQPYQKSFPEYPSTDGPLAEEKIKSLFLTENFEEAGITCRILSLYYLLYYEELYFRHRGAIAASNSAKVIVEYSRELFNMIPVFYLVTYVDKNAADYSVLDAQLLGLAKTRYPYFFSTHCSSFFEFLSGEATVADLPEKGDILAALKDANDRSAYCILMLKQLLTLPLPLLLPYMDTITSSLVHLLDPEVPRKVLLLMAAIWNRLEFMSPWKLYCSTVQTLLDPAYRMYRRCQLPVDHNGLCEDVLLILHCDSRVFRCPTVLQMVLRILHCYMFESRRYIESEFNAITLPPVHPSEAEANTSGTMKDEERKELKMAMISAQEADAVHLLLKNCLPNDIEKGQKGPFNVLSEIHDTICSFLHSLFISDPLLIKLIHFQGYSPDLIPMTVSRIPSMHICLDFIPEILCHADRSKQIFAIKLLASLCKQYTMPKAFSCAKLALHTLFTLVRVLSSAELVDMFCEVVPSCFDFCSSFPPLASDVAVLLADVGKMASARIPNGKSFLMTRDLSSTLAEVQPSLATRSKEAELLLSLRKGFREKFGRSVVRIDS